MLSTRLPAQVAQLVEQWTENPCAPAAERANDLPPPIPGARWIPVSFGLFALVDEQDFPEVSKHSWSRSSCQAGTDLYAKAKIGSATVRLHRFVWSLRGLPMPESIDHRDMDGLNCRLGNLRGATRSQNNANRLVTPRSTTGFKGVARHRLKYRAQIAVDGKSIFLGCYSDAEAAARAYDAAAVTHFGEFARLNFPADGFLPARTVRR